MRRETSAAPSRQRSVYRGCSPWPRVPPAGVGDAELRGGDALPVRLRVGGGDPPAVRVLQHQPHPGARRVRAADRDGNHGVPATVRGFGLHGEGVDAGGVPLAERKRPEAAGVQRRGPVPAEAAGHLAEPVVRRDAGHRDRVAAVAGGGFGRIGRRLEADLQLVALGQLPAEVESVRAEAVGAAAQCLAVEDYLRGAVDAAEHQLQRRAAGVGGEAVRPRPAAAADPGLVSPRRLPGKARVSPLRRAARCGRWRGGSPARRCSARERARRWGAASSRCGGPGSRACPRRWGRRSRERGRRHDGSPASARSTTVDASSKSPRSRPRSSPRKRRRAGRGGPRRRPARPARP